MPLNTDTIRAGASGVTSATSFYPHEINQSLKFDGNIKLLRTPTTTGNQKKWTTSWWIKRNKLGALQYLWSGANIVGNDGIAAIYINSDDKIHTYFDTSGSNPYGPVNNRVYRDTSNWYHMVWAVDAVNTVQKIYINGVEESISSSLNPPNFAFGMNRAGTSQGWGVSTWGGSPSLDAYLAELVHLDGQYLTADSFGEFKNDVWVPKEITGLTFGTNGYHLTFQDSSNIGYDYQTTDRSGTTNDYTTTGVTSADVFPDTCTNNFATLNPNGKQSSSVLTEGNLNANLTSGGNSARTPATFAVSSGKWYWEVRQNSSNRFAMGVFDADRYVMANEDGGSDAFEWVMITDDNAGASARRNNGSINNGYGGTTSSGQVAMVALDADNGAIWFGKQGTWFNNGTSDDSATVKAQIVAGTTTNAAYTSVTGRLTPSFIRQTSNNDLTVNFGGDSTFHGGESAATNTDSNSRGQFQYEPPTNFLSLNSLNLPSVTLGGNSTEQPNDYFNTKIYTGDGTSPKAITGVGFQPDWVWFKQRSNNSAVLMYDSNRGVNKNLRTDSTNAEDNNSIYGYLSAFGVDGFTLTAGTTNNNYLNENNQPIVSWNWRANGANTSTNTTGDINSTVQTSDDAGFSLVTYTGNGTSNADVTIGHGLTNLTPRFVMIKNRTDSGRRWQIYHEDLSADSTYTKKNIILNLGNGESGYSSQIKAVSSTTFTVRDVDANDNQHVNKSGSNYVAFVFAEIEGYSKFGTYTGNVSTTDGPMVMTGFSPAWILIKRKNGSGSWTVYDNKRNTFNPRSIRVPVNLSSGETDTSTQAVDFYSNGFKLKSNNTDQNGNGDTYIYLAFAKNPFSISNAR